MNIILVHGAYSDGNCWSRVTECLRDRGNNVVAVTLSGHTDDYGNAFDVTMKKYGEDIIKEAEKMDGPSVLIGHSLGGCAVTVAGEMRPELFEKVIYVCAVIPKRRYRMITSRFGLLSFALGRKLSKSWKLIIKGYATIDVLMDGENYEKMDDKKSAFRNTFVTNEPIRPMFSKIKWTDKRLGNIPKVYVETLRDRMLTPKLQRYYMKRMKFECVRSIDSGHSPFFSKWEDLCDIIEDECRKDRAL
ncbi:alpha/beta fold hydrolase [Dethiosulfatibacter aminovorans]|nr:alpha/beta hydrolase [Dethiosulfatibacter aminovorans]